jgi:Protein of unknown function (DUF3017)
MRALRWIGAQLAFLGVLAVLAVGFAYLLIDSHRTGPVATLFAASVLLAGLLRAVLPTRHVGMLAVRSRPIDVLLYLALGGLILALDIRLHV